MIMLTCSCLNIRVHSRGNALKTRAVSDLTIPETVLNDQFFSSEELYACVLDLAGVTVSQQRLSKQRELQDWSIIVCSCCAMDVYAKHVDNNDVVFVSTKSLTDSNRIYSMMDSEKYSPLFKLILPEVNDNFIHNIGVEFPNGNIDRSIEVVQGQVSNYLKEEQRAMEVRIKKFNLEQQDKYSYLLNQVRKHKQAMVYLMFKSKEAENTSNESPGDSALGSPSALNRESANESSSTDSAFDRSETAELPGAAAAEVKPQRVRSLRRAMSNPSRSKTKGKRELKRSAASIDVGGVFDMEFDSKEENLSGASDGETEDSESEVTAAGDAQQIKSEGRFTYGNSLPMSIPAFTNISRYPTIEDDEKDSPPKGPIDIAASIRALACSVRDGTEMFGELPRRRLNTGELLSSRPF